MRSIDTRTFYDRLSGVYDLIADSSEGACRDQGVRMLNVAPGERVLEIGCGTGHALAAMASVAGLSGTVVGIDVSSGMLAVARRTLANGAIGQVALALGDARALCFPDAAFDAVFMSFTLELLEADHMAIALREVARVLRAAGRLGVVAMAQTDHTNAMTDIYRWLHRHFPHFVDCRPIDVRAALEDSRFGEIRAEPMTIWGLSVLCAVGVKRLAPAARVVTSVAENRPGSHP